MPADQDHDEIRRVLSAYTDRHELDLDAFLSRVMNEVEVTRTAPITEPTTPPMTTDQPPGRLRLRP